MTLGDVLALAQATLRKLGEYVVEAVGQSRPSLAPWLRRFCLGIPSEESGPAERQALEPPATTAGAPASPDVGAGSGPAPSPPTRGPAAAAGRTTGLPRVPPSGPPAPREFAGGTSPPAHDADRIGLFPRDPYWLFAYWQLRPRTRVEALRRLGAEAEGATTVLRVYEHPGTPLERATFDVELSPGADRWHLQVPHDDTDYAVEVGLRTMSGAFLPFVRSDVARTPPAGPSEQIVVEWYTAPPPPPAEPTIVEEALEPEPAPAPSLPPPQAAEPAPESGAAPTPEPATVPGVPPVDTAALLAPGEPRSSEALGAR